MTYRKCQEFLGALWLIVSFAALVGYRFPTIWLALTIVIIALDLPRMLRWCWRALRWLVRATVTTQN